MVDYEALVSFIASSLVTCPEEVKVCSNVDEKGVRHVEIRVASEDMGRVIGRRGGTITALRQLVRVAASKAGDSVDVEVAE